MKTKTKIENQIKKKTNKELVETIIAAKKNKAWLNLAGILSSPRRNRINLNLNEINEKVKDGEKIVIPGKVLSQGELDKKIEIVALCFSEKAKEKINKAGSKAINMLEEIKKNPEMKGAEVFRE